MKHSKQYYRDIKLDRGFKWIGAGDHPNTHMFQRGNYKEGFSVIECGEQCITNGDLEFLIKQGMTCDNERLKQLSKEYEELNK